MLIRLARDSDTRRKEVNTSGRTNSRASRSPAIERCSGRCHAVVPPVAIARVEYYGYRWNDDDVLLTTPVSGHRSRHKAGFGLGEGRAVLAAGVEELRLVTVCRWPICAPGGRRTVGSEASRPLERWHRGGPTSRTAAVLLGRRRPARRGGLPSFTAPFAATSNTQGDIEPPGIGTPDQASSLELARARFLTAELCRRAKGGRRRADPLVPPRGGTPSTESSSTRRGANSGTE